MPRRPCPPRLPKTTTSRFSSRRIRGDAEVLRVSTALILALLVLAPLGGQAQPQLSVGDALDSYARGDFQRVIDGRPFAGMNVMSVIQSLEGWVGPINRRIATP